MKKILSIALALLLIVSCDSPDDQVPILENEPMGQNIDFQNMVDVLVNDARRINESLKERGISSRNFLYLNELYRSKKNYEKLAELWGFDNFKEFEKNKKRSFNIVKRVLKKYPSLADGMTPDNLANVKNAIALNRSKIKGSSADCQEILQNCTTGADGALVVMTAACIGTVFVPFIGPFLGPACQAGAVLAYDSALNECIFEYEDCREKEINTI